MRGIAIVQAAWSRWTWILCCDNSSSWDYSIPLNRVAHLPSIFMHIERSIDINGRLQQRHFSGLSPWNKKSWLWNITGFQWNRRYMNSSLSYLQIILRSYYWIFLLQSVFVKVNASFKKKLLIHLRRLNIPADAGPQNGWVPAVMFRL